MSTTGANSGFHVAATRDTILLSQQMADAGADAVLVINPSYYKSQMMARIRA